MPVLESPRGQKRLEPFKRGRGDRAVFFEKGSQFVTGAKKFGFCPTKNVTPENGGRGLPQGTGFDILRKARHAPVFDIHIHRDSGTAKRRAFLHRDHRRIETPDMRNISRQRQKRAGIKLGQLCGRLWA